MTRSCERRDEFPRELAGPFRCMRPQREAAVCGRGSRSSPDPASLGTLILDFEIPDRER